MSYLGDWVTQAWVHILEENILKIQRMPEREIGVRQSMVHPQSILRDEGVSWHFEVKFERFTSWNIQYGLTQNSELKNDSHYINVTEEE